MENRAKKIKGFLIVSLFFSLSIGLYFFNSIKSHNFLLPINTFKEFDTVFKVDGFKTHDLLNSDISMQFLPYRSVVSLDKLVFWNPYSLGGLPFFEDIQARSLEITNLLANLFNIGLDYFLFFSVFILLLFGAISMYYFVRELKLGAGAAIFSAISFCLSTPVIIWISYTLGVTFIWLPFLFLCVEKISNRHKIFLPILSLAVCWQLFAGHPQAAFLNILFVSCYIVYKFFRFNLVNIKKTTVIFIFLLLGIGLSAIQTLPSFNFIRQSEVYKIGRSLNSGSFLSVTKSQLVDFSKNVTLFRDRLENRGILLLAPRHFGDIVNRNYRYPENPLFYNFFETSSYAGILTITLAILSLLLIKKRKLYFWVVSSFVALVLCFNLPFFNLISLLPVLNKIDLGRLIFSLIFSLSILAAHSFEEILGIFKRRTVNKKIVSTLAILLVAILFIDLYKNSAYLQDQKRTIISDFQNNNIVQFLNKAGNYRYIGLGKEGLNIQAPLLPNQSMIYKTYDLRGYFVMLPNRFLAVSKPYLSRKRNFFFTDDIYNQNFLSIYGVKYIICPNDRCSQYEQNYSAAETGANVKVLENKEVWPRAFVTYNYKNYNNFEDIFKTLANPEFSINDQVLVEDYPEKQSANKVDIADIKEYSPDSVGISANAKEDGILVLTDNYYDGWRAYVNNQEVKIIPVFGSLRGVPVKLGFNEVVFRYKPRLFNFGLSISVVSFLLIFFLYHLIRKRNNAPFI